MFGIKLTNIRLERADEKFLNNIKEFCRNNRIHIELSPAHAPYSNVAAECLIQDHWT